MPELPEVETTLRGISPHISHQKVTDVVVRHTRLRWPVPANLKQLLVNQVVQHLSRRGKYILFGFKTGTLILHLGMSGSLRVMTKPVEPGKHDHVDICFANKKYLRFTDPRRFGALLWTSDDVLQHALLKHIGPEPLTKAFNGRYLFERAKKKKVCVKSFIMDSKIVAGVGNIYAVESLFDSCVRPQMAAGKVSREQFDKLAMAIKKVLKRAIVKGGTTLKDFMKSDGAPGYFAIELRAYGHGGEVCPRCGTTLKSVKIGQRGTVFCPRCQK